MPTKRTTKRTAKKTSKRPSNKRTTKRAAPKPPAEYEGPNPFRAGTNNWHICEALMKGGKASALVKRLLPKLEYNPRKQKARDFDAEMETDRRLMRIGYLLRDEHGFSYVKEGRGEDAFIQATPPG